MTEPLPEGAKAFCLDCKQYLWMANPGWVDSAGRSVCLHRATLPHVAGPIEAVAGLASQTQGKV